SATPSPPTLSLHDALPILTPPTPAPLLPLHQVGLVEQVCAPPGAALRARATLQQSGLDVVMHADHGQVAEQRQIPGQGDRVHVRSEEHTSELQSPDHLV